MPDVSSALIWQHALRRASSALWHARSKRNREWQRCGWRFLPAGARGVSNRGMKLYFTLQYECFELVTDCSHLVAKVLSECTGGTHRRREVHAAIPCTRTVYCTRTTAIIQNSCAACLDCKRPHRPGHPHNTATPTTRHPPAQRLNPETFVGVRHCIQSVLLHRAMAGGKERLTRRDRKAAETGEPKKVGPKLTQEEQDELEEKELEEWC